jgi:hypothetical protein
VRFWRSILIAAAVLVGYGFVAAQLTARELAALPPTTTPQTPVANIVSAVGFALMIATFGLLGRAIARARGSPGQAAGAGALAGIIAAVAYFVLQTAILGPFVRSILAASGIPERLVDIAFTAGLAFYAIFTTGFGALLSWLGSILFRPRVREELV